jgi:hypothetical protein
LKFRLILPGIYLLFAAYIWWDFTRIAHDGLANMGLMLATAPVAIVGLIIDAIVGSKSFSLLPTGNGYLTDHALYYVPAAGVTGLLFWWIGRAIDRRRT